MGTATKMIMEKADEREVEAFYKRLMKMMKSFTPKLLLEEEEEDAEEYSEEDYNICVYQMLPYPPNTKDPKDSFIQRT
jgi:hypothetical protein